MKFDCGETWPEAKARKEKWHRFFCLFPRKIADHDCRWLEYVERRGVWCESWADASWDWRYRAIEKNEQTDTT
jgi:hypothetical protein